MQRAIYVKKFKLVFKEHSNRFLDYKLNKMTESFIFLSLVVSYLIR